MLFMLAILLTGPPAVGKSTVARILQGKLDACMFPFDAFRVFLGLPSARILTGSSAP